jgi:hypothetical protein
MILKIWFLKQKDKKYFKKKVKTSSHRGYKISCHKKMELIDTYVSD